MKKVIANILMKLARALGAEAGGSRAGDRSASAAAVDALLMAKPAWGGEAAAAVHHFLNTPADQLYSKRMRAVAAQVAIDGANDRVNTIHAAGVSAGWYECVRYLHSLSRVSGDQDTRQGAASHLNDKPVTEDEAQLLERLSP